MVLKSNLTSETKNILLAVGNRYRRDDGAACRVLELLGPLPDVEARQTLQLMPEMAIDFASARFVVFVDADIQPVLMRLLQVPAWAFDLNELKSDLQVKRGILLKLT